MTPTIHQSNPGISDHLVQMVAEVLACRDPNPEKRRAHRIAKIESFPESDRADVREATNRVIQARIDARRQQVQP